MQKLIRRKKNSKTKVLNARGLAARLAAVESAVPKAEMAQFRPGDTVKVHTRITEGDKERIQIFEGVVIARFNSGANRSFTVRKMSHGVGVERIFTEASPKVAKVELVQPGMVRRAKLYYLRALEGRAARIDRDMAQESSLAAAAAGAPAKAKPAGGEKA